MLRFYVLAVLCLSWLPAPAQSASASLDELAKKAEAGDAESQFLLGRAYEEGNQQDDEQAVKWYRKSADQGNARAQNSLGVMYRLGRGVSRDKEEAFRWYRKAAKQALPEGDFNVAICYYNGDGVASDINRAYAWMAMAKRYGSAEAEPALTRITEELHGRTGFGTMILGELYEKGDETPKDLQAAFETYQHLADSDVKDRSNPAQMKLCQFYANGTGVPRDPVQAKPWCKKVAKAGYSQAMLLLGQMAENGAGEAKNLKEAEDWYREAAADMAPEGFMAMARLKLQGSSRDDQRDAYYWFYLASILKIRGAAEQAEKIAPSLSSSEISKAQKKAIEWSKAPRWKRGKP